MCDQYGKEHIEQGLMCGVCVATLGFLKFPWNSFRPNGIRPQNGCGYFGYRSGTPRQGICKFALRSSIESEFFYQEKSFQGFEGAGLGRFKHWVSTHAQLQDWKSRRFVVVNFSGQSARTARRPLKVPVFEKSSLVNVVLLARLDFRAWRH